MQILWDSSVVIVSAVVLCAPAIALAMSKNNSNLNIQGGCFPGKVSPLMAPKLGENAYAQTQNLRCPEVQDLSRSIRSVAQCYYQKGNRKYKKSDHYIRIREVKQLLSMFTRK